MYSLTIFTIYQLQISSARLWAARPIWYMSTCNALHAYLPVQLYRRLPKNAVLSVSVPVTALNL